MILGKGKGIGKGQGLGQVKIKDITLGDKVNCKIVKENLTAYLHGELNKKEVKAIHLHLSACEVCLEEEMELRKTSRIMDKFQFEALPENFDAQLHQKLSSFQKPKNSDNSGFRRIVYAIAATLVVTIGLEFFIFQFMQSTEPTIQLTDFPTTQTVFKSASEASSKKSSLKQRYLKKYFGTQEKHSFRNNI